MKKMGFFFLGGLQKGISGKNDFIKMVSLRWVLVGGHFKTFLPSSIYINFGPAGPLKKERVRYPFFL